MSIRCPHCDSDFEPPFEASEIPEGITIRPALSLQEIERLIVEHAIVSPCPSRQTLIRMIRRGELEGRLFKGLVGWSVFEDSFWNWANVGEMAIAA